MISHDIQKKHSQKHNFGYRASEATHQRTDPGTRVRSSDDLLTDNSRRRLIEGARELWRNYSVAAWAIRKHLDYVSTFSFHAKTGNERLDQELESIVDWWNRPANCDVANRHSLRRMMRIWETRRTIDGDVFVVKFNNGRLQSIEGDRIRNPDSKDMRGREGNWVHGVLLGPGGKSTAIAIHRRDKSGRYEFERQVSSNNFLQLAYFDSFDQVRGVSPLASAINSFSDIVEVTEYARLKAKVTQLFAMAITRQSEDYDDEDEVGTEYQVDFGKGPIKIDMDPGDDVKFLESKHPSTEFQSFITMSIQAALKSLDIPYSFADEAYTNYSGARAAWIQYIQSCKSKRDDMKEMLDRLTGWRLNLMTATGSLRLPRGVTVADLRWEWIPAGVPWIDPAKEIAGDIQSVEAGLRTLSEIRRERYGDDWRDVVRKRSEELSLMEQYGLLQTTETMQ